MACMAAWLCSYVLYLEVNEFLDFLNMFTTYLIIMAVYYYYILHTRNLFKQYDPMASYRRRFHSGV